jgi:hypothetical protein
MKQEFELVSRLFALAGGFALASSFFIDDFIFSLALIVGGIVFIYVGMEVGQLINELE